LDFQFLVRTAIKTCVFFFLFKQTNGGARFDRLTGVLMLFDMGSQFGIQISFSILFAQPSISQKELSSLKSS